MGKSTAWRKECCLIVKQSALKRPMSNMLVSEKNWNDGRSESKFSYTCKSNSAVHRRQNHCGKLLRKY